jgi:hypothetical protein
VDSVTIGLIAAASVMLLMYLRRRKSRLKNDDFQ